MGHDMPAMCSMNMLFTWDTTNLCIIFRGWHIRSTAGLIFSLLAIILLTAGYEALRKGCREYEKRIEKKQDAMPNSDTETTPFFWSGQERMKITKTAHATKAFLYAVQNFYAFMLMLLFMTYNGWVMVSMFVGWFVGYLFLGLDVPATKDTACH